MEINRAIKTGKVDLYSDMKFPDILYEKSKNIEHLVKYANMFRSAVYS